MRKAAVRDRGTDSRLSLLGRASQLYPAALNLAFLRFKRLLKRAGLSTRFTLYSLRHTFATLQYTKALPVMREQASDSLEKLLFGAVRATFAQSASELPM